LNKCDESRLIDDNNVLVNLIKRFNAPTRSARVFTPMMHLQPSLTLVVTTVGICMEWQSVRIGFNILALAECYCQGQTVIIRVCQWQEKRLIVSELEGYIQNFMRSLFVEGLLIT
jgi:hypothetical protein